MGDIPRPDALIKIMAQWSEHKENKEMHAGKQNDPQRPSRSSKQSDSGKRFYQWGQ